MSYPVIVAFPVRTVFGIFLTALLSIASSDLRAQGWDNERPSWTPNGDIVFSSNRSGNWDLFSMNADGSDQTNLTNTGADELFPAVSPDGQEIAFVKLIQGNHDIYVLNRKDGSTRRLTTHDKLDDWPSWTDGGNKIVFDSDRSGTWAIHIMDADGSNKKLLVDYAGRDIDPHSTPDSPWVVFSSERQDGRQIYAYHPDRDQEIQLTRNNRTNGHPAINPAGTMVAYNSGTDFWYLYVVSIDGGDERLLVSGEHDNRWSSWSPEGSRIAFESNRDGNWEIYVLELEELMQTRITHGAEGLPR